MFDFFKTTPLQNPKSGLKGVFLVPPPPYTESNVEGEEEDLPQLPPLENASQKHACDIEKVTKEFEDSFSDSSSSFADDRDSDCEEGEATPLHASESTRRLPEVAKPLGDICIPKECYDTYDDYKDFF